MSKAHVFVVGLVAALIFGAASAAAEPRIRNVCVNKAALDALIDAHQRGDEEAAMDARHKCLGSVAVADMNIMATGILEGYMRHSFCRAMIMVDGRKRYVPLDAPMCNER